MIFMNATWIVQILKCKRHAQTQLEIQMNSYAVWIMGLADIKIVQIYLVYVRSSQEIVQLIKPQINVYQLKLVLNLMSMEDVYTGYDGDCIMSQETTAFTTH